MLHTFELHDGWNQQKFDSLNEMANQGGFDDRRAGADLEGDAVYD
jgi:hypothetical protein